MINDLDDQEREFVCDFKGGTTKNETEVLILWYTVLTIYFQINLCYSSIYSTAKHENEDSSFLEFKILLFLLIQVLTQK